MKTAVQLRPARRDQPFASLVHGSPVATAPGARGAIAFFLPGQLVAYRIRYRRRTCLFVFRTLDVDDRLAASLPGVRPRVQLLIAVRTEARARLLRSLFEYLLKSGHDPKALPDAFYLRASVVLGGRLPAKKILHSLLYDPLQPHRLRFESQEGER